ncbi:MAG: AMP-binding protein, partial [Armatimonadetes bacterium]|nr:AMP-binding protein [Armatimonadota bacterium]
MDPTRVLPGTGKHRPATWILGVGAARDSVCSRTMVPAPAARNPGIQCGTFDQLVRREGLGTLWSALESGDASAPALVAPEGARLTYGDLRAQVRRTADALAGLGVRPGDRVALVLPNGVEAVVGFLGAALAGTAAPLNPGYTEEEFRFYLEDTSARVVIVPQGGGEAARAALPDGAVLVEARQDPQSGFLLEQDGEVLSAGTAAEPAEPDIALILHTSGTTSRPKRVPLTHANLSASLANIIA